MVPAAAAPSSNLLLTAQHDTNWGKGRGDKVPVWQKDLGFRVEAHYVCLSSQYGGPFNDADVTLMVTHHVCCVKIGCHTST